MAALSRSTVYPILGIVVLAVVVWATQDSPPTKKTTPKTVVRNKNKEVSEFTADDYSAKFGPAKPVARNVFVPLVVATSGTPIVANTPPKDPDAIPPELAGGDPNWIYTGFAMIDGSSMALLENTATHRTSMVHRGDAWLTSTLSGISPANIVLVSKEGLQHVVLRHVAKPDTTGAPSPDGNPGGAPGRMPPSGMPAMPPGMPSPVRIYRGGRFSGPIGLQISPVSQ